MWVRPWRIYGNDNYVEGNKERRRTKTGWIEILKSDIKMTEAFGKDANKQDK